MAITHLDLGTTANDGNGDSLRVGGQTINDNFDEVQELANPTTERETEPDNNYKIPILTALSAAFYITWANLKKWIGAGAISFANKNQFYFANSTTAYVEIAPEYIGGGVYLNFNQQLSVRGTVSIDMTWAALADAYPSLIVTSPLGVANCFFLASDSVLVFNIDTYVFSVVARTTIADNHVVCISTTWGQPIKGEMANLLYYIDEKRRLAEPPMKDQILPIAKQYMRGISAVDNVTPVDRFTIVHITDLHYDSLNADNNLLEVINFLGEDLIDGDVNLMICSGDVCNGTGGRTKATTEAEIASFMDRILTSPIPVMNTIGNHDDNVNNIGSGWDVAGSFATALTKQEQYEQLIKPMADLWIDNKDVLNKGYSHRDHDTEKVRIIVLDSSDVPIVDSGDGTLKYKVKFYYSQDQLDWFYTTLNSTPAGYGVILVSHGPAVDGYSAGAYEQGYDLIYAVIDAYKNGTSYVHSFTDSVYSGDLTTSKTFDFTSAGGREFICHLSGHIHTLDFIHPDTYTDQWIILTPNLWTGSFGLYYAPSASPMLRNTNEAVKNSFNIISVDRRSSKIIITTFGAFRDADLRNSERVKVLDY